MTDIRNTLEALADSLERLENRPAPVPTINDRGLSGNKINGGRITNFSSAGIRDSASDFVLTISDDGIHVATASISTINNPLTVQGNLTVNGEITATRLHVDEISADIRNERTSPLEFKGDGKYAFGKGLIWTGGDHTKQLVLQGKPERIWSSESIDIKADKEYLIGNQTVLSADTLGPGIRHSNLRSVGTLTNLSVDGNLNIDNFVIYDGNTQQLGIGANETNGMLTMESWDHQFVIDSTDDRKWKLGSWTTCDLDIITDNTPRISISASGNVTFKTKTNFEKGIGIGVKNFTDDADLTVAGPIRFQNKKFEVSEYLPTSGNYTKGDIVWNENPQPTGYVGWICVREGSPGEWKPFGQISA